MHHHIIEAAIGAVAAFALPAVIIGMSGETGNAIRPEAHQSLAIEATLLDYPLPGEFLAGGVPVAAPVEKTTIPKFDIMRRQVSLADYSRCVTDGACDRAEAARSQADVPVTGVSFRDAQAYARWYSRARGENWRLPTAAELAVAAAERFVGEAFPIAADDAANPSVRWLRRYREEAAAKRPPDPKPKTRGHYGPNSRGVEDFGGNVWEWTSTCYARNSIGADGLVESVTDNCGVRVLEGRHRSYMSTFVRDGKSGGCAVGTPPENLGFRLVRDRTSFIGRTKTWLHQANHRLMDSVSWQ
ncbi:formylglycine-generating enzyme family protein [Hoeflea sp.]|uniref:formylglycine-generating enzyme family protein n=1 Tax=Hoeflea sp. TaxID=1940281 RepID=UPI003B52DD89